MTPDQVLDMNLDTLKAVIEGYQEHLFDERCLCVYQGYWTGYYSNAKHPKPLSSMLSALMREHAASKRRKKGKLSKPSMEVDVETFLAREQRMKELQKQ